MSSLVPLKGHTPQVGPDCFIADTARIIGEVRIGRGSSIWYNTTLRGDVMPIVLGDEVNVQDGSVLHGTFGKYGCVIGDRVTIGHAVVLHGCEIGRECLIGMGSIVMDAVKIGAQSIVGAGSLVTEGSVFPEKSLILGRPAKVKRPLTEEEIAFLSKSADNYILYKSWYTTK
ncbi:MAG: gamma carbonic anhydrase family protein [Pseudobdellovibrionaceae bacterium]|jgi:carbonic anhydrase/acetyltransferase-like protein (isoleucine patch superfamily)